MSFPAPGRPIPEATAGNNISFSQLRTSWSSGTGNYSGSNAGGTGDPGSSNLALSEFDKANLSNGTSIDADGTPAVSIGTHFCGKTFLIPVTAVTLRTTTATPNESTVVSNYATIMDEQDPPVSTIVPLNANGTITYAFTTASTSGGSATPATTAFQANNQMNYTFSSVGQNENVGGITVNVRQNGSNPIPGAVSGSSADITIQNGRR